MIALHIPVFGRSRTTVPGAFIADLAAIAESYEHSATRTGGFEAMSVTATTTLDDAVQWLDRLFCPVTAYGPNAQVIWDGFISGVSFSAGDERTDLSLDAMANAVRVRYQPGIGPQVSTAFGVDSASIGIYGRKELVYSGSGMNATAATALRDRLLQQRKLPVSQRSGGASIGSSWDGSIQLTITATGWYYTLDWLTTVNAVSATAVTTTQVQNLTTAYVTSNNQWLSTNYRNIEASGVSDTQWIDADTPYREKIETLLDQGNSAGELLAWGIYEDRQWRINTWAGADPTGTPTYRRSLGSGQIVGRYNTIVDPWDVRPDAMYQVDELVSVTPPTGAIDQANAYYVERVTCKVDRGGASVTLGPSQATGLDVLLARIG